MSGGPAAGRRRQPPTRYPCEGCSAPPAVAQVSVAAVTAVAGATAAG